MHFRFLTHVKFPRRQPQYFLPLHAIRHSGVLYHGIADDGVISDNILCIKTAT